MKKNDIIEMIPEYLNGNLTDNDIELIESAAKDDNTIRMEIEFMKSIQQQLQSEEVTSPTEWGWSRLKRTIESEASSTNYSAQEKPSIVKPIWKKMAIAASFAFVIQSAYLAQQQLFNEDDYRLLSTDNLKNSLQVKFKEQVSEQDIRLLLVNMKGNIVSGPSAIGIYSIQFKDKDNALVTLRNNNIIEYVELSE